MRENYSIFCKLVWVGIFKRKWFKRRGLKFTLKFMLQDSKEDIEDFIHRLSTPQKDGNG